MSVKEEVLDKLSTFITSAFGLVAALAYCKGDFQGSFRDCREHPRNARLCFCCYGNYGCCDNMDKQGCCEG